MSHPQDPSRSSEPSPWGWQDPSGDAPTAMGPPALPPSYAPHPGSPQPTPYAAPQPTQPTQPYGVAPAYGAPQQPYAAHPYGVGSGPTERPGTVLAAAIVTFVFAGITALLSLIVAFVFLVGAAAVSSSTRGSDYEGLGNGLGVAIGAVAVILLVVAAMSIVAIVLAAFTLKGSNGARIGLVVLASLSTAAYGLGVLGNIADGADGAIVITIAFLAASVATIVLLFVGGANAWFAAGPRRPAAGPPAGAQPYDKPYGH